MFKCSRALLILTLSLMLPASLSAQNMDANSSAGDKLHARQVIASAGGNSLRFASLGEFIQMRLEVISPSGESLYDSAFKPGNLIDWSMTDMKGERLADGSYLCIISVKDAAGRITIKQSIALLHNQSVSLAQPDRAQLTVAQAAAAERLYGEEAGSIITEPAQSAATAVLAHDGSTAHIVSGGGGLAISGGDLFSNRLSEQVRLTPEGNLGIGLSKPQVRLDVEGMIRATRGIVFPDGSVQYSAATRTFGARSSRPGQVKPGAGERGVDLDEPVTNIGGAGTTGRIPRWLDGPNGILTDSNITEVGGAIGINATPSTSFRLDVNGSTRIRGSNPGFNLEGQRAAGNIWLFQTVDDNGRFRLFSQDNVNPGQERLTISLATGNVGIGTNAPAAKLDVAGVARAATFNATTDFSINGDRVLTGSAASANVFAGIAAGASNTSGVGNSFFGENAGDLNSTGSNNTIIGAFAGDVNQSGSNNTIIGAGANVSSSFFTNATAIGANAIVSQSNSLVLGNNARVGIGTSVPTSKLMVAGAGGFSAPGAARFDLFNTTANKTYFQHVFDDGRWQLGTGSQTRILLDTDGNISVGGEISSTGAGLVAANNPNNQSARAFLGWFNDGTKDWPRIRYGGTGEGAENGFLIQGPGDITKLAILQNGSVGIGTISPSGKLTVAGSGGTSASSPARFDLFNTTANRGYLQHVTDSGAWRLIDTQFGHVAIFVDDFIIIAPRAGDNGSIFMRGVLTLGNSFPESPPAFPVCFNEFFQLGLCGSSIRFKENVNPFTPGLNLVKRLRPVSFDWKKSGIPDLGLVAEEVADVEPLLVTHDDKGQIQGVKYDRLGVLLINAVNELKAEKDAQISALKSENAALRQHNAALDARISAIELIMKKELVANRTATRRPRRNGAR